MQRVVFATALAGIAAVAVCGTLLAAPSAPLPVAATSDNRPIVQAHNLPESHYPYYWLIIIIVIGPGTVIAGTTI